MGTPGFDFTFSNVGCYFWRLFRGLFLWPFTDIWTDVGMQMVMLTYLLLGIGTILMFLILKNIKEKGGKRN